MQKGMSPPHSPQKQQTSDKTVRNSVQKSAPTVTQTPYKTIKGLYYQHWPEWYDYEERANEFLSENVYQFCLKSPWLKQLYMWITDQFDYQY